MHSLSTCILAVGIQVYVTDMNEMFAGDRFLPTVHAAAGTPAVSRI